MHLNQGGPYQHPVPHSTSFTGMLNRLYGIPPYVPVHTGGFKIMIKELWPEESWPDKSPYVTGRSWSQLLPNERLHCMIIPH